MSVVPQNSFSASVSLSISGLPSGVTGTFTQNPLPTGQTSDLIIQAAASVTAQNASLQVNGASGSLSNSQAVTLNVVSRPTGTPPRSSYISMDGPLHEIVYDPVHKLVFAANPQLNEVEVISTTTRQRLTPLLIPQPWALDVTPDGTRLWVGTTGEFFYAVDLASLQVVERVTPPRTGVSPLTTVRAIVTTANGSLFLRMGQIGVTTEGLLQYLPAAGQFLDRSQDAGGVPARLFRSADGSKVLFGFFGTVVLYDAATDTFLKNPAINGSPLAAIRPDGAQIAMRVGPDLVFLNSQLQEVGRVGGMNAAGSPVYSRDGRFVYLPQDISIIRSLPTFTVIDTQSFTILGQLPDLFLTDDLPPFCGVIDVCDSTPGGTTLRASEESGLLIGPSPRGLSFVDASNPRALSAPRAGFNLNRPYTANPTQGSSGGGTQVTLSGGTFVSGASVALGPNLAAVTSISSDQMRVIAPSSSVSGPVNISASFPNGWSTLAPMGFSYGPQVQYFLPMGDRVTGGSRITILGYGFGSDPTQISVSIGGQAAPVVGSSLYAQGLHLPLYILVVNAPAGVAGPVDLTISTPAGKTTLPGAFRYWQSVREFPLSGNFTQILFDHFRGQLYLLNPSAQRIEVFSTSTLQVLAPMPTGASPAEMTLLPDGSRLAVANFDDNTVSLIDPANPAQPRIVNVALVGDTNGFLPARLAATSTGKLFINYVSQTISGGRLQVLDLRSLTVTPRTDSFCGACLMEAAANGSKVFFAEFGSSGGEVSAYDATSDSFSPTRQLQQFLDEIAPAADANRWVFNFTILNSTNAVESDISIADLIVASSPSAVFGERVHPSGGLLYLPLVNGLHIYDLPHARLLRIYAGLSLSTGARRTIALDDSGQTLYAISPTGLQIATLDSVPLSIGYVEPPAGPAGGGTQLTIRGSGFAQGAQIRIGGVNVTPQFVDANTLRIMSPPLPGGSVRITVINPGGESFDLDAAFTAN